MCSQFRYDLFVQKTTKDSCGPQICFRCFQTNQNRGFQVTWLDWLIFLLSEPLSKGKLKPDFQQEEHSTGSDPLQAICLDGGKATSLQSRNPFNFQAESSWQNIEDFARGTFRQVEPSIRRAPLYGCSD